MAWTLFLIYLVGTTYLGYLGSKRTKDFSSFAIGDGDMSPVVVGITLAASTASAATFIINPGFVYVHGLSAFMHLGVSVFAGILCMLLLASYRFRSIGTESAAVTIPHWLGLRYQSRGLAIYFALVNLFSFAFLVLLVGGISIVMQQLLGISNLLALVIILVFVTGYVIMGGTYAHVFTNLLQGSLMIIVSIMVIYTGWRYMLSVPDFWSLIEARDPLLTSWTNAESPLYSDWFSVYISGFLIGAALVCQPHILTKALYVKSSKDVSRYIGVFAITYCLFTALLLAGFWAIVRVPEGVLLDSVTGGFRQDLVMTQYLKETFSPGVFTVISVVLLAAAMSTLDGLMVGLSTITANDLWLNLTTKGRTRTEDQYRRAYRASHVILLVLAILTFVVAIHPPKLLGIFGQFGVYALVLTSLPPLLNGIFCEQPSLVVAWTASVLALVIYIGLYFYGEAVLGGGLAYANPAVPAGIAILTTALPAFLIQSFFIPSREATHA